MATNILSAARTNLYFIGPRGGRYKIPRFRSIDAVRDGASKGRVMRFICIASDRLDRLINPRLHSAASFPFELVFSSGHKRKFDGVIVRVSDTGAVNCAVKTEFDVLLGSRK